MRETALSDGEIAILGRLAGKLTSTDIAISTVGEVLRTTQRGLSHSELSDGLQSLVDRGWIVIGAAMVWTDETPILLLSEGGHMCRMLELSRRKRGDWLRE